MLTGPTTGECENPSKAIVLHRECDVFPRRTPLLCPSIVKLSAQRDEAAHLHFLRRDAPICFQRSIDGGPSLTLEGPSH
jgi:hypothetical protein